MVVEELTKWTCQIWGVIGNSDQSGDKLCCNGKKIGIGLPNTTEKFEIAGDDNFESIMENFTIFK